jgi:hypothetical protein
VRLKTLQETSFCSVSNHTTHTDDDDDDDDDDNDDLLFKEFSPGLKRSGKRTNDTHTTFKLQIN